MSLNSEPRSAVNTRNLLLVSFLTLTVTALIFLFALVHFDRTSTAILRQVDDNVSVLARNSELNRLLVSLELDIRDMINIILHESYRLTDEKESLRTRFRQIAAMAAAGENSPPQKALLAQLDLYHTSFEKLLWDYGAINSALYEVYYYLNSFSEQFQAMEEAAAKQMVDLAMQGKNTDAQQQAYLLIAYAQEMVLQIHILVNSGLADHDSRVLVKGESKEGGAGGGQTVTDKITGVSNILQTLRASDASIAAHASSILDTLPLFAENVTELAATITTLDIDTAGFKAERDACLQRLEEVNAYDRERMLSLGRTVSILGRRSRVIALFLALAVLVVSGTGLLLTRRMGRHLAVTADAALQAQLRSDELNRLLQGEIEERQRAADDLRRARDELELKVQERTAQLSASNRFLAQEIEERKAVEYALASEKERLVVTLRSIGDGVITTDVNGTIDLMNKAAEELTGWSQKEACGQTLHQVFRIVDKVTGEACPDLVQTLLRTGSITPLGDDTVLIAQNGSRRDVADTAAPIRDRDSAVIGVVLVFRDVTVKRKLEEDALMSEKLQAVGVLAGGIAHDFNNILAAILGSINLARLRLGHGEGTQAIKLLEDAEKASLRAKGLTQQLLTFAKGGEPVRRVAHIAHIIQDSADFILSGGKVHCRYALADNLWPVSIDAGQISQVIQNIVINAMHAMPDGGQLEISCENVSNDRQQLLFLPAGNFVRIRIKDQGTGIPAELLDRIFDPYFTTKEEGSGLGLALTHSIVSKHQGYIEVESGGWGTAFTIYLPALAEHLAAAEPATANPEHHPMRARVLVMDDEDMVREIARDMLLYLGFEVDTANDGEQALAIYRERLATETPVDLVIMDLTIPGGMGGKEAILKLREIDPGVRAIVSSGYSNDPVMADYQNYGFAGVVNKPFQLNELLQAVTQVLGKRPVSPA